MKRLGRFFVGSMVFLAMAVACSKDEEPTPTVGCTVTFKGSTVALPDIVCEDFQGLPSVVATNLPGEQELILQKNDSIQTISFVVSGDADSNYRSLFATTPPTVTISGKTWTFSGTLVNNTGDTGSITGTCTCSN
jgi:hypothetical protein